MSWQMVLEWSDVLSTRRTAAIQVNSGLVLSIKSEVAILELAMAFAFVLVPVSAQTNSNPVAGDCHCVAAR